MALMSYIGAMGLFSSSPFTEYFSIRGVSELTIYGLFERVNVSCAILGHAGSVATPVDDLSQEESWSWSPQSWTSLQS